MCSELFSPTFVQVGPPVHAPVDAVAVPDAPAGCCFRRCRPR